MLLTFDFSSATGDTESFQALGAVIFLGVGGINVLTMLFVM
jgi:hypothetical protein